MSQKSLQDLASMPRSDAFGDLVDIALEQERIAEAKAKASKHKLTVRSTIRWNLPGILNSSKVENGCCSTCGQSTPSGANFCMLCGSKFIEHESDARIEHIKLGK